MEFLFFFKQKTAYEMRISDWSSDVCSSDLREPLSAALNATYCLFHRTARRTNRRNTLSREAHLTMQDSKRDEERRVRLAHLVILIALQSVMAAELVLLTIEQQWVHVFLVAGIMLTMAMPVVDRKSTRRNSS